MKKILNRIAAFAMLLALPALAHSQSVYDFSSWASEANADNFTDYLSDTYVRNSAGASLSVMKDVTLNGVTLNTDSHFAFSADINTDVFKFTNSSYYKGLYAYSKSENTYYFSVINLKAGDKVQVIYGGNLLDYLNDNFYYVDDNGYASTPESGTQVTKGEYSGEWGTPVLTVKEDGQIDFVLHSSTNRWHGIAKVYITTSEEKVYPPSSIKAVSAHYGQRTVKITAPKTSTGGDVYVFYTLDGQDPDPFNEIGMAYEDTTNIVIDKTTTIKAMSFSMETQQPSEIVSETIEAGFNVPLPVPTFTSSLAKGNTSNRVVQSGDRYFSSVNVADTVNVLGYPRINYVVNGDTIAGKYNKGNVYTATITPTGTESFEIRAVAEGYDDGVVTVNGVTEFTKKTVVDLATFVPNALMHQSSDAAWNTEWHLDTLAVQPQLWLVDSVTAIPGLILGSHDFCLAEGLGIVSTNEGSKGTSLNRVYVDTTIVSIADNDEVELAYYTPASMPSTLSLWRSNSHNLGCSAYFPGPWNMALKAANVYSPTGSETTGIENIATARRPAVDDAWYNLSGQRVAKPSRGIYIHNGKKYVIK